MSLLPTSDRQITQRQPIKWPGAATAGISPSTLGGGRSAISRGPPPATGTSRSKTPTRKFAAPCLKPQYGGALRRERWRQGCGAR